MISTKEQVRMTERQRRIFDFIRKTGVGVLASVSPDGDPHASVVYITISPDNFAVSFLTKSGTKKYDNLTHNDHVTIAVFEPTGQTVAQVIGVAREISDVDVINDIAATVCKTSLESSPNGVIPIAKLQAGDYVAFKITPKQIRIARYQRPSSGGYDRIFESLESFELKPVD